MVVPDDRKSYTARGGGVPSPTEHELIVSVVPEMNPMQVSSGVPDASETLSVVKSCGATKHEPRGAVVGQAG
jgi:hypothetical protein